MIEYNNGLFHLSSEKISYIFKINGYGMIEHIYFGKKVNSVDADVFAIKPGTGWGTSVVCVENDYKSCPDIYPLEWSTSGRGDYRESPIEVQNDKGVIGGDFKFSDYRIISGQVRMDYSLPQVDVNSQTLELELTNTAAKLKLKLYYVVTDSVIVRRTVIENLGKEKVYVTKLMSMCMDLQGKFNLTTFNGGWIAETHKYTCPIGPTKLVNESLTGFSSNRHNPGFIISDINAGENSGDVFGFNLLYSGNHYSSVQRSLQGLNRVMSGINPDCLRIELGPNVSFETPESIVCYSGSGFNGMSQAMHDFVNSYVVPEYWRYKERPVLYNDWEGCMFDFTESKLISLAKKAKKSGCELFVLDDGWFGNRDNEQQGLGDYFINEKKLPNGLKGLCDKINAMGMEFGLWFEPEGVNPNSELYKKHPDWILTDNTDSPLQGRFEYLLDLSKPEVRDYIVESVCSILDSVNISYVKWDMNRHSSARGNKAHEYILGLYEILHRIFDSRPHILLESCSSGGNRFDLGMIRFSPQVWCSDDTDPVERMDIQKGLSYLYPQSCMGCHVSAAPHAQTLRETPLYTRANVSFFGSLGYELNLNHLTPMEEREIKKQIAFYKKHKNTFQFGRFSRNECTDDSECWQVSGNDEHIIGTFKRLVHAAPEYEIIKPTGLESDKVYSVENFKQNVRIKSFGSLVNYVSPVSVNPNKQLFHMVDSLASMPDETEKYKASGAALMSGINLAGRYSGTGYSKEIRLQSDFGSNIYVIKEI